MWGGFWGSGCSQRTSFCSRRQRRRCTHALISNGSRLSRQCLTGRYKTFPSGGKNEEQTDCTAFMSILQYMIWCKKSYPFWLCCHLVIIKYLSRLGNICSQTFSFFCDDQMLACLHRENRFFTLPDDHHRNSQRFKADITQPGCLIITK